MQFNSSKGGGSLDSWKKLQAYKKSKSGVAAAKAAAIRRIQLAASIKINKVIRGAIGRRKAWFTKAKKSFTRSRAVRGNMRAKKAFRRRAK